MRRSAVLGALAAAGLLLVLPACAAGESVTRKSFFDSAPADLDVQTVTLEVTGRRSTLFGDEEAEARLRRIPGVHDVARTGGRNTFMVLADATVSPDVFVMTLEGDFVVHVGEVVRRPPR
jgi:hypothetical protein